MKWYSIPNNEERKKEKPDFEITKDILNGYMGCPCECVRQDLLCYKRSIVHFKKRKKQTWISTSKLQCHCVFCCLWAVGWRGPHLFNNAPHISWSHQRQRLQWVPWIPTDNKCSQTLTKTLGEKGFSANKWEARMKTIGFFFKWALYVSLETWTESNRHFYNSVFEKTKNLPH